MIDLPSLLTRLSGFLFGAETALDGLDEHDRRWIRAAQIGAVVQLVPLTMTINFLNATIVVYVFWDTGPTLFLVCWGALIGLIASASILSWGRTRRMPPKGASARAISHTALHGAVLAGAWGAAPLVLFPDADLIRQLILACLMAGMISGGAFGLSTVPKAGLAYTWIMVTASMGALFMAQEQAFTVTALLLSLYAIFISRNLSAHGTLFVDHLRDKLVLKTQGEVIGLLLRDFQEHSSDWLWEADADGRLMRVSDRFARAAGREKTDIEGALFCDVVDCGRTGAPEIEDIVQRMKKRSAFRDMLVPVQVGANWRCWSLSAKPVFDSAGAFIGYRGVGADVTEKRRAEERIAYLARYDTVTGLPNRSYFHDAVDLALADGPEDEASAAILFIDLDQFKSVNDTLGHHVGDALLKGVGERIANSVGGDDVVARLGGDEFAVLQHRPDGSTRSLANRLVGAFKEPFNIEHGDIVIGASVGVAIAPEHGQNTETLLKSADLALYGAKANGSGTYCFFEPEMEEHAHRRHDLEVGLRMALENGEIGIEYQPLIDLDSGTVAGCEALMRWNSPEWGEVSPLEFIPVAEATGLVGALGEWVLNEATKTARQWPAGTTVAVNLSAVQFRQHKLLASVVDALVSSGLPPQRLELEVTESVFLDGSEQTLDMLNNLRTLGVRIALDDFGTGYSSLSYLRRFPFDKIKIDKSFVDQLALQDENGAIVGSIVALANGLGMTTTAEGVESALQVERLRALGCAQVQGHLYSPPVPADEIAELIARRLEPGANGARIREPMDAALAKAE